MKTIHQIKEEVAKYNDYIDIVDAWIKMDRDSFILLIDECIQEYAKQVAIYQREECANKAVLSCKIRNINPEYIRDKIKESKLVVD